MEHRHRKAKLEGTQGPAKRNLALASADLLELGHVESGERGAVELNGCDLCTVGTVVLVDEDSDLRDIREVLHFELADSIAGEVVHGQHELLGAGVGSVGKVDVGLIHKEFDEARRSVARRGLDVQTVEADGFAKFECHQELLVVLGLDDQARVRHKYVGEGLLRTVVEAVTSGLVDQITQVDPGHEGK